jgi:hypothetical protein
VRQAKLVWTSWTIQPGQRLATRPELNFAYKEVTNYAEPKGGWLSAITQVKVLSPEIYIVTLGQGFHFLEASTAACAKGEHVSGVSGSKSMAGNRTVHIGTWESHAVPIGSFQQAEEARRRYGSMAVGPAHIRGVAGVMPGGTWGSLEGAGSITQRDEDAFARH